MAEISEHVENRKSLSRKPTPTQVRRELLLSEGELEAICLFEVIVTAQRLGLQVFQIAPSTEWLANETALLPRLLLHDPLAGEHQTRIP